MKSELARYAKDLEPLGTRILVRKYTKPEMIGSIHINPAWQVDNSRALWEVVKAPQAAKDYVGLDIQPDWILVTLPNRGLYVEGLWDAAEHYLLFAEEIVKYIPKTW